MTRDEFRLSVLDLMEASAEGNETRMRRIFHDIMGAYSHLEERGDRGPEIAVRRIKASAEREAP